MWFMNLPSKKIIKTLLRLTFSILLLIILYQAVDMTLLLEYFRQIQIGWIAVAFFLLLFLRFIVTIKWQIILNHHDITIPFLELAKIIFISTTIGQILPAGIGTDILRGYSLAKKYGQALGTTATIIIDRAVGMFSLFFVALIGAVIAEFMGIATGLIWILAAVNTVIILVWLNIERLGTVVSSISITDSGRFGKIKTYLVAMIELLSDKANIRRFLPRIFLWSLVIQVIRCTVFFLIYLGFGEPLNFMYFVVFIPVLFVITLIPISIGGLGVREGVLVVLFSSVGAPAEVSIGVGLLSQVLQIFAAVPVLVIWLFEK